MWSKRLIIIGYRCSYHGNIIFGLCCGQDNLPPVWRSILTPTSGLNSAACLYIVTFVEWLRKEFGLVSGISQLNVTITVCGSALSTIYYSMHLVPSDSSTFTSPLVKASNVGASHSSSSWTVPVPQPQQFSANWHTIATFSRRLTPY
jgi:hypothetical protein